MISDPNFFFDEFVEAGSDSFIVHWFGASQGIETAMRRLREATK